MANYEERITRDTAPHIRLEHEVRYRSVRSLVLGSSLWCDLGCGEGVAAAAAVEGRYPGRAVLVDVVESAVRQAEHQLAANEMHAFRADLSSEEDLTLVRDALFTDAPDHGCITCFELIEHLTTFVPLVGLLVEAAATGRYTVVVSVPNDAFWSMENPYHQTVWGDAAFEEFRRLLPDEHVLGLQLELRGSTLVRTDTEASRERQVSFNVPDAVVASHLIAAFGPRAHLLEEPVKAEVTDREAARMWERQRESDLAFYRALAAEREAELVDEQDAHGPDVAPPAQ